MASLISMRFGLLYFLSAETMFVEWEMFSFSSTSIIMILIFDWMSLSFTGLVMFISSMVLFYSIMYMEGDKFLTRFIFLVYFFVLSMVFMILSPNMISILLGWDGLGLVSYCLVIYYQNVKSANAGMITVLSNRVGDVAILLCISWLLNFGSWNFFYSQFVYSYEVVSFMVILVILAAMTKSAQMPFSAWLPAAMAAPTPVSALVHSSTLVTAGVYLLIRFNYTLGINNFLLFIGMLTMFMSGLGANFEMDLKKIIALSTLSQLGLMMTSLGLGFYEYAFFHLLTHAMFKSLLFLCAGVFIHSMGDTQDIRAMGGLMISCPVTSLYFIISSMALCGFPFLSGFFSSDMIIEFFFQGKMNLIMGCLMVLSTLFTLTYSVRLLYFSFFNNMGNRYFLSLAESINMLIPMTFLIFMSVLAGGWLSVYLFPMNFIFLPLWLKLLVVTMIFSFFFIYFFLVDFKVMKKISSTSGLAYFLGSMWLLPFISTFALTPIIKYGVKILNLVDQGWVEFLGGQGFIDKSKFISSKADVLNSVSMKFFMFSFFMGVLVLFLA
uniref:NADH-ubiquinone oxidoreductase chain 5 n=1 Tax=Folsomia candida TaxID=158441 RepID=A0A1S5QLM0_FOLCA|nr:NADH dehydrogenase subunit 5 [Folsomia candida]